MADAMYDAIDSEMLELLRGPPVRLNFSIDDPRAKRLTFVRMAQYAAKKSGVMRG